MRTKIVGEKDRQALHLLEGVRDGSFIVKGYSTKHLKNRIKVTMVLEGAGDVPENKSTRVYFAHVLESYDERFPVNVTLAYYQPGIVPRKGKVKDLELTSFKNRHFDTKVVARVIGLGYTNFDKYPCDAAHEVIRKKLWEVGVGGAVLEAPA